MDTTRALCLLATLSLAAPAAADYAFTEPGALPRFETRRGGQALPLPLEHTDVKAEVSGFVARVEVTQRYGNPFAEPIEAEYVFPLPQNAAVDDFKMVIGERHIEGIIKERAEARRTYEAAKRAGQTAALLEQQRPNLFTQSVANIAPGEKIEIVIRYVQTLVYDDGAYEFVFPMVAGPKYVGGSAEVEDADRINPSMLPGGRRSGHDISVQVSIDAALPIRDFETPTHEVDVRAEGDTKLEVRTLKLDSIPNRDFVMRWWVDSADVQAALISHRSQGKGYFSLLLQPPELDLDELVGQRELVFVVDVSGSMSGLPMWLCQQAMRDALARLRPGDTFNVITFAGRSAKLWPDSKKATQSNVQHAMRFVDGMKAGGRTEMINAIDAALGTAPAGDRHRYVFFLTDGYVGNEKQIFRRAREYVAPLDESRVRAKVFTYGVGSSVNRHLIEGVAEAGEGVAFYATTREDPTRGVNQFFRVIDHPVLTDVWVDWGDFGVEAEEVFPSGIPDLFASRPVMIHGRFSRGGPGTITVQGRTPDGERIQLPVEVSLPKHEVRAGSMSTLWARAKVHEIEASLWDGPRNKQRRASARERIISLGLRHRLVTRYTSFVAVDRSRTVGEGDPKRVVQAVEVPEGVRRPAPAKRAKPKGVLGLLRGGVGTQGGSRLSGLIGKSSTGSNLEAIRSVKGVQSTYPHGFSSVGGSVNRSLSSGKVRSMSKKAPKVRSGPSRVTGTLDRSQIVKVIQNNIAAIQRCYERELLKNPKLSGKLVVSFTIGKDGAVKKAKAQSSTLNSEAVSGCIVRQVKRWKFPRPGGGGSVEVSYPFLFRAG